MTGSSNHKGFTLIELLMVVAIIGIIAALAIPGLLRARIAANEASAIGSLRTVVSAQAAYHSLNGAYADDLADLALVCALVTQPFISADLNTDAVIKSGYRFELTNGGSAAGPGGACGEVNSAAFYALATPEAFGTSGTRGFATSANMTVWQSIAGPPGTPPTLAEMGLPPTLTIMPLGR